MGHIDENEVVGVVEGSGQADEHKEGAGVGVQPDETRAAVDGPTEEHVSLDDGTNMISVTGGDSFGEHDGQATGGGTRDDGGEPEEDAGVAVQLDEISAPVDDSREVGASLIADATDMFSVGGGASFDDQGGQEIGADEAAGSVHYVQDDAPQMDKNVTVSGSVLEESAPMNILALSRDDNEEAIAMAYDMATDEDGRKVDTVSSSSVGSEEKAIGDAGVDVTDEDMQMGTIGLIGDDNVGKEVAAAAAAGAGEEDLKIDEAITAGDEDGKDKADDTDGVPEEVDIVGLTIDNCAEKEVATAGDYGADVEGMQIHVVTTAGDEGEEDGKAVQNVVEDADGVLEELEAVGLTEDDNTEKEAATTGDDSVNDEGMQMNAVTTTGDEDVEDVKYDENVVEDADGVPEEALSGMVGEDIPEEDAVQIYEDEDNEHPQLAKKGRVGRKRGRQSSKAQFVLKSPVKRKDEEEVCFICFDGGDLVVCDRRFCPKAYHPSCVNRDDEFFKTKGRWNCEVSAAKSQKNGYSLVHDNSLNEPPHTNDEEEGNSDSSSVRHLETNSKRRGRKRSNQAANDDSYVVKNNTRKSTKRGQSGGNDAKNSTGKKVRKLSKRALSSEHRPRESESVGTSTSSAEETSWASKELLDFVATVKNGDTSVLSQFEVQALLLEYIKRENLRDPRRKSQIICDSLLKSIFGKHRVGHFEMLKLLESHFLMSVVSPVEIDDNHGGVVDPDPSQVADGNSEASVVMSSEKKKKSRKYDQKALLTNLDDYAAIDNHNISLMYLRRNLLEELIGEVDTFDEKVLGSFVRIRIPGTGQRQDIYRLVQIVGTGTAPVPYKCGKKTTDITLEILNLDKRDVITVDITSNQEFTEEECKRLRQSIKCGFIPRLTVGELYEKAVILQDVKVNDWIESEKMRLGHLRDRAIFTLRECVEKLQLLSTPEERARRLNEEPEVHADNTMDPDYESPEEQEQDTQRSSFSKSRGSLFRKDTNPVSPANIESEATQESQAAINESEKIWQYIDPSGKIQGPFSILQLRKWNSSGYFPPSLKIWKSSDKQDDSISLTDALLGKFDKDLPPWEPLLGSSSQIDKTYMRSSSAVDGRPHGDSHLEEGSKSGEQTLKSTVPGYAVQSGTQGSYGMNNSQGAYAVQQSVTGSWNTSSQFGTAINPMTLSQPAMGGFSVGQNAGQLTAAPAPVTVSGEIVNSRPESQNKTPSFLCQSDGGLADGNDSKMGQVASHERIGSSGEDLRPAGAQPGVVQSNAQQFQDGRNQLSTDASYPGRSSQLMSAPPAEAMQPLPTTMTGGDNQNSGWPQLASTSGQSQAAGNMTWGTTLQGNANMGWGMMGQNNMNMPWGAPAQSATGYNMSLTMPAQPNAVTNMGWVAPNPVNTNMNMIWAATQGQGTPNAAAMMGTQMQGVAMAPWGAIPQGNASSYPGWGAQVGNTNQNIGSVAPVQGNPGPGAGNGPVQGNNNMNWNSPSGNSRWNNQQRDNGGRHSGHGDDYNGGDSGGRSWRSQSGGDGGSRGQRKVCFSFVDFGYCRRGEQCRYAHSAPNDGYPSRNDRQFDRQPSSNDSQFDRQNERTDRQFDRQSSANERHDDGQNGRNSDRRDDKQDRSQSRERQ
ncbi:hypothetical protein GUJ93_ZPchr0002g25154 [Zizania palustris]|uniref:Uncharacterized protein n=1 Tax=Zizania palustris TaxID=103762 RepID=A0A8J5RVI5_ZIZPA|nr:hypothetical protein GUJ93_ZPchr0002g25154 [Zizania palustris]